MKRDHDSPPRYPEVIAKIKTDTDATGSQCLNVATLNKAVLFTVGKHHPTAINAIGVYPYTGIDAQGVILPIYTDARAASP